MGLGLRCLGGGVIGLLGFYRVPYRYSRKM